jgi:hypothetical protein
MITAQQTESIVEHARDLMSTDARINLTCDEIVSQVIHAVDAVYDDYDDVAFIIAFADYIESGSSSIFVQ